MTDAEIIQLERQIEQDTEATQIRLNSQYCPTCGTRKIRGKCEYCDKDSEKQRRAENSIPHEHDFAMDTTSNSIGEIVETLRCIHCGIEATPEQEREYIAQFNSCGNYTSDEVADMRHPNW